MDDELIRAMNETLAKVEAALKAIAVRLDRIEQTLKEKEKPARRIDGTPRREFY